MIIANQQNINTKKHYSISNDISKISNIFNREINISIWKRNLNSNILHASEILLIKNSDLQFSELINKNFSIDFLIDKIGADEKLISFYEDIQYLTKLFCELFDIKDAWLRIDAIDKPMCPRFHADHLKCRLVTTYYGPGTQWLPNNLVNRNKLGHGNNGLADDISGLFSKKSDIENLDVGDIGLLKGEAWVNNEGLGLVHRSPHTDSNYKRLYVTIDFGDLYRRSIFNNNY
tara:strand:- start:2436 stop:3131 length:696 start_codon:yes stop_codon:yes gene_type:complete